MIDQKFANKITNRFNNIVEMVSEIEDIVFCIRKDLCEVTLYDKTTFNMPLHILMSNVTPNEMKRILKDKINRIKTDSLCCPHYK